MICDDLHGKEIEKRVDIWIGITDSLYCIIETNNIVKQLNSNKNYTHTQKDR